MMNDERRVLGFRRLALAGALLAACVVVLGAWVRLTDAGLGCPDWPGCYGHVFPQSGHQFAKALHEMLHRYVAGTLAAIITALFVWAIVNRRVRGQPLLPVALLFAVVCVQAALGMKTVTLLLQPLIVTAHLLGGLTTLSLLWWLSLHPAVRPLTVAEASLRKFAVGAFLVLVAQIALGGWTSSNYAAVACPDLPTCQHSFWPQMDYRDAFVLWRGLGVDYEGGVLTAPARVAIHFTHRLGAVVAGLTLIGVGVLVVRRSTWPRLIFLGGLLVCAVLLQISIGVSTVHWGVPLPLATLHNAGAAFLVIVMTTLLRALWPGAPEPRARPAAPQPAAAQAVGSGARAGVVP
jgi:cytochrome c oxidase assembly protein subunit 15